MQRWRGALLSALLGLFVVRVLSQLLVANGHASFLPPMEEWQSGALPYPLLLASQLAIVVLFGQVCIDLTRRRGFFATRRRTLGSILLAVGSVYLAVMVARYAIHMALYPPERWAGGSIPILLHWILAGFILLVGAYHWQTASLQVGGRRSWRGRAAWAVAAVLAGFGILLWLGHTLAPTIVARVLDMRAAEFAVRVERGVPMTTSDGVTLPADIYHPVRAGPAPVILVRIPLPRTPETLYIASVVGRLWAERGYTVVVQETRPLHRFGGTHYPLRHERQDGIDTLAWVARQSWFEGRLGMWGGSYFGYTQWVLADRASPGPSALLIQLWSSDSHGMFYSGGAFSLESALFMAVGRDGEHDLKPTREEYGQGYRGFPLLEADEWAVGDVAFFNDWASHTERDAYWLEIDGEDRPRTLRAPALLMAGWYDPFLPAQLADFARIRREADPRVSTASRLIIGPWVHADTVRFPDGAAPRHYRLESIAHSVGWFDQHLRGAPAALQLTAPLRIYVMGAHVWRDEQEWPLARTRYTPYYLHSTGRANTLNGDGELRPQAPTAELRDSFVYDPLDPVPTAGGAMLGPRAGIARQNEVEARPDVLVYTTGPLDEDVEVTGPVTLLLHVATTAPSTDFTAKLVDVHPDGSAYNISDGMLRRSYDVSVNAEADPTEISLELWPTSMVFRARHRIRLEVSSSNYPRFDRNPNTGRPIPLETAPIRATQTVYHGPATPSRLILPVISRP